MRFQTNAAGSATRPGTDELDGTRHGSRSNKGPLVGEDEHLRQAPGKGTGEQNAEDTQRRPPSRIGLSRPTADQHQQGEENNAAGQRHTGFGSDECVFTNL